MQFELIATLLETYKHCWLAARLDVSVKMQHSPQHEPPVLAAGTASLHAGVQAALGCSTGRHASPGAVLGDSLSLHHLDLHSSKKQGREQRGRMDRKSQLSHQDCTTLTTMH